MNEFIRYMIKIAVVLTAVLSLLFIGITVLIIFSLGVLLKIAYYVLLVCCAALACYFFYCFIRILVAICSQQKGAYKKNEAYDMSKGIKILIGVVGGLVALIGLVWGAMEIIANHGINHLYDKEMDI